MGSLNLTDPRDYLFELTGGNFDDFSIAARAWEEAPTDIEKKRRAFRYLCNFAISLDAITDRLSEIKKAKGEKFLDQLRISNPEEAHFIAVVREFANCIKHSNLDGGKVFVEEHQIILRQAARSITATDQGWLIKIRGTNSERFNNEEFDLSTVCTKVFFFWLKHLEENREEWKVEYRYSAPL